MLNPYILQSETLARRINNMYIAMARKNPRLFGAVYTAGQLYRKLPCRSPVYYANRRMVPVMQQYLSEHPCDIVITTHLYPAEILTNMKNSFHLPYEIYHSGVNHEYQQKIQVSPDSYTCHDALYACKVPVLFIHGTGDHFVPVEMTYENYKSCASEKRLFVVPGADHGMSYVMDKAGYENAVKAF